MKVIMEILCLYIFFEKGITLYRIQHYFKIHGGEHLQRIMVMKCHVWLMISSENFYSTIVYAVVNVLNFTGI